MLTAERNVKFHSSQTELDLCTVENVILNEDPHEDTKPIRIYLSSVFRSFSLLPLMIIARTCTLSWDLNNA